MFLNCWEQRMKIKYGKHWNPKTLAEAKFHVVGRQTEEEFETNAKRNSSIFSEYIRNKKVLEYGCGMGRLTKYLFPLANEYTAADSSQAMINYAKMNVGWPKDGLNFFLCDGSGNGISGKYNFIFSYIVLQHIFPNDVLKIIKNLYSLLLHRGIMLLDFPKYGKDAYGETKKNRYRLDAAPFDVDGEFIWTGDPMTSKHYAHGVVVYDKEDIDNLATEAGISNYKIIEFQQDDDHWFLEINKS